MSKACLSSGPSSRRRNAEALGLGVVLAAAIGLAAAAQRGERFWLVTVVFAVCAFGPAYGVGWLLRVAPVSGPEEPRNAEDTVESRWLERASAAAFGDLVVLMGVVATVVAVTEVDPEASLLLGALLLAVFLDVAARVWVLRRREA